MITLKPKTSKLNRVFTLFRNSFSASLIESPKPDDNTNPITLTESPELPIWVKISQNVTKSPDDDFVLPSLSYWIENYKQNDTKQYDQVIENSEDDVKKNLTKILSKHFESVESVTHALNEYNVTPSEQILAQIMKRYDNNWKSAYGLFVWAELRVGYTFSQEMYDLLVDCLGKSKKFDLMWQVVNQMNQNEQTRVTINTISKVIRRLAKAGLHEEAIDAFRRIREFGIEKDVFALNVLIDSLVKEKNVERANDVFHEYKDEICLNSSTFNALIHGWAKCRKVDRALSIIEEMKEYGICPDVVTYTSIIEAYCSEKDFRKVDELIEEMERKGCPPNIVTYTIVMHARGKVKEIDEALKVYEKIKASGCVPDTSFYSSLIYILSKAGRMKDAREVFDEMPEQGIKRDTQTFNTMITSVCSNGQEEDALKLLREMEMDGVKPDFDTYAPLLKMCLKLKRMKVVSFLLSHMLDNNVSVGMGTYSLLVRGLCKNGKLKHACVVLEDAIMKGFVPYDTMFKLLETELEKQGMTTEKKRIQELRPKNMGSI
ncbi:pentatricopeptide repeat-containing protein At3g22670, mitochondrial [Rutidosis leptorrhynchoides]|uniref:pentatricopeptide repeat-containing protein At3g22670, mitochondrial n=1 Tax=Rutidosis leptorrhynchoides TaxID=125765 RepID=UPI003A9A17E5